MSNTATIGEEISRCIFWQVVRRDLEKEKPHLQDQIQGLPRSGTPIPSVRLRNMDSLLSTPADTPILSLEMSQTNSQGEMDMVSNTEILQRAN